jgi:hypothetical protein
MMTIFSRYNWRAILVSIVLIVAIFLANLKQTEGFYGASQGGALVQLATSHVPTMVDIQEARRERRQVMREVVDMTRP